MTRNIGRLVPTVNIFAAIGRAFAGSGNSRTVLAAMLLTATVVAPLTSVRAGFTGRAARSNSSLLAPSGIGFLRFDTTFDGDGKRADAFGLSSDSVSAAALLPDGKIVAAVSVRTGSTVMSKFEGVLVRFNPDGTRDTSFALGCRASAFMGQSTSGIGSLAVQPDGKVVFVTSSTQFINPGGTGTTTSSSVGRCNTDGTNDGSFVPGGLSLGNQGNLRSVAVRPDGKIVIAGRTQTGLTGISQLGVFRLNPNGSLDSTFAGDGQAFTPNISSAGPIALQSDGKVFVAGTGGSGNVNLLRVDDTGAADPSFHGDGYLQTPFTAADLAVQADGKLLVAGTVSNDFAVARYNSDGTPDMAFDTDGVVTTPVGPGTDTAQSIAVQADGKIVVAGRANNGTNDDLAFVRYNTDGSLDTSFDGDGKLMAALGSGDDSAASVLARDDGKLVAVGTVATSSGNDIGMAQYLPDGSADTAFGVGGKSVIDVENQGSAASAVAVQSDGKVVVAGSADNGNLNSDFAVARYNTDGSLDTSFDGDGKAVTQVLSWNDSASSVAVQPDGKIVAAGRAQQSEGSSNYDFAVVRYNADGSLDTTFDGDGKLTTPVSDSNDQAYSVAIQADGKIVVAGEARGASNQDVAVVRYNEDGSLDNSFDFNGMAVTPVGSGYDRAASVKIQPDGKIVAAGEANGDFALVRYNTDGSLDAAFDTDGKVISNFGSTEGAYSAQLQADGKIVAAGISANNFAIARYNTDGTPDASFGTGGTVVTDMPGSGGVTSVAIQTDGKILAAGNDSGGGGSPAYLFARYHSNGSLDATFDLDGKGSVTGLGNLGGMTLDGQNKILAVGGNGTPFVLGSFTVARLFSKESRLFDHEGNGAADLSVWRPSTNVWYTQNSLGYSVRQWGQAGDKLAPADYDGDGSSDLAIFRPSDGSWRIWLSSTQTLDTFTFGQAGDLPVPADRNADGKAEPVLYRPGTSTWHTRFSSTSTSTQSFGASGDQPLLGDFDADGRADNAVFRPSNSTWYVQGTTSGFSVVTWGAAGDKPVPADYDGDGKTDIAIYRPSTGQWYIIGSMAGWMIRNWGIPADIPVPADYDADGKADLAIFRPSTGTWYIVFSATGNYYVRQFGQDGDVPIPSAFID